jgi:acyl-CoA synthetase (AMP-forming)/AMP-acid ligase II/alkylation response protein AidB-like acyl-CoA dehydrogenase/acyl carrier protein
MDFTGNSSNSTLPYRFAGVCRLETCLEELSTIASLLRTRAALSPDLRAFTFLPDGEQREEHRTYRELESQADAVAYRLCNAAGKGSAPVLVVFPAGFDFLTAFFGCMFAGAIAVPTRYPGPKRPLDQLKSVAADSGARLGITTPEMVAVLSQQLPQVEWWALPGIDAPPPADWVAPQVTPDDIAYLQYTSGSTSAPKGVVICHRHVVGNCREMRDSWRITPDSRILSWLPHFHDMGLILGMLETMYVGCSGYFMPPMAFVQRPLRWLAAITRYKITHSVAPNFAYAACTRISPDQLTGLDLSSWCTATNGAEQVRADTLERFARLFEPYGFSRLALCPGYGLAENTLMVTSHCQGTPHVVKTLGVDSLRAGRFAPPLPGEESRQLVGCGGTQVDTRIVIVNPDSCEAARPNEIGEIWLSGPSVAGGYWQRPEATAEKFGARLAHGEGPFLRTGDLGVVHDGEIFILGRRDDLMIVRGANYHPDDLELAIEESDPKLQPDGGAVFAIELQIDSQEETFLVVAQEVQRQFVRHLDADELVRKILRAVSERYDLEVSAVVLLPPRALPKTHSGKKQRRLCRQRFLEGSLRQVAEWVSPRVRQALSAASASVAASVGTAQVSMEEPVMTGNNGRDNGRAKVSELLEWLRSYAAERVNSRLWDERRCMPPYVVLDLGNRGVLSMQAPERYGGLGLDNRQVATVLQQLAAIDVTLASFVAVNNALGVRPILRYAKREKREELLPILGAGRELAAFAVTEPGAGSNVRGIAAQARGNADGGWNLWGTKIWSGSSSWAGVINTFVQLDGTGPGQARGITGFVVRQPSPGLRMGPEALTMGLRAMVQNEVRLEGVHVTAADMLGEPGQGMVAAMDTMEFGRYCLCAASVGVIKRCLQLMARHASRRTVASGRLLDSPVTLMRFSDLTAAAAAVEALSDLVGERLDKGLHVPPEFFCACKTAGPEFAWRAADSLVQQLAGRGFIESNIAPQILRDTRILRIFEGPTEPMNMHIGSKLMHDAEGLRSFLKNDLRQSTLAAELEVAAARISDRCLRNPRFDRSTAQSWASSLAGEVGTYGILLAAVRTALETKPSADLRRAEEWTRERFERRLAKALSTTPAESVFLNVAEAEATVRGYESAIGDVEQTMAGEQWELDPLLRRDEAGASATAAAPAVPALASCSATRDRAATCAAPRAVSTGAQPVAATGARPDIVAYTTQWIVGEFGCPKEAVTPTTPFSELGMDSVTAMKMITALESKFMVELPSTLIWDYPTVAQIAEFLAAKSAATSTGSAAPPETLVREQPAVSRARVDLGEQDELKLLADIDNLPEDQIKMLLESLEGSR